MCTFLFCWNLCIIYERIMCEKNLKKKKSTIFRARLGQKPGFFRFRAPTRENFEISYYRSVKIAPFEGKKGAHFYCSEIMGEGEGEWPPFPSPPASEPVEIACDFEVKIP